MNKNTFFNIIIIVCLIMVILKFIIEYMKYKKAPNHIKAQISFKGYPFLIITNILFVILALIETLIRIGFFIK